MKKLLVSSLLFAPILAFAQTAGGGNPSGFDLIQTLENIVNAIIPFLIGLAVLVFLYGIFSYILAAGDEEKRKTARDFIIWGIISLFIMVAVWGLVNVLGQTFGLNGTTIPGGPVLPGAQVSPTLPR